MKEMKVDEKLRRKPQKKENPNLGKTLDASTIINNKQKAIKKTSPYNMRKGREKRSKERRD